MDVQEDGAGAGLVQISYVGEIIGFYGTDDDGSYRNWDGEPHIGLSDALIPMLHLWRSEIDTHGTFNSDRVRIIEEPTRNVAIDIRGRANVDGFFQLFGIAYDAAAVKAEAGADREDVRQRLEAQAAELDKVKADYAKDVKALKADLVKAQASADKDKAALVAEHDKVAGELVAAREEIVALKNTPKTTVTDNRA